MPATGTGRYLAVGQAETDRVTPAKAGGAAKMASLANIALDTGFRWYDG